MQCFKDSYAFKTLHYNPIPSILLQSYTVCVFSTILEPNPNPNLLETLANLLLLTSVTTSNKSESRCITSEVRKSETMLDLLPKESHLKSRLIIKRHARQMDIYWLRILCHIGKINGKMLFLVLPDLVIEKPL